MLPTHIFIFEPLGENGLVKHPIFSGLYEYAKIFGVDWQIWHKSMAKIVKLRRQLTRSGGQGLEFFKAWHLLSLIVSDPLRGQKMQCMGMIKIHF